MNYIQQITIQGAGAETSNGTFTRNSGDQAWFYSENGSHIEPTVLGWTLVDSVLSEQTYMFDHNFETVTSVGDCIEPVPSFELIYTEE